VSSDEDFPSTPGPRPSILFSRKGAKHVLSNVEGFAKGKNYEQSGTKKTPKSQRKNGEAGERTTEFALDRSRSRNARGRWGSVLFLEHEPHPHLLPQGEGKNGVTLSLGEGKRGASMTAEYVGSKACVSCHGKEAAERVLGSAEGGIRPKLCYGFGFQVSDLEFRIGFFHMARLLHIGLKSNLQLFGSSIERAHSNRIDTLA
jgi:hypothetical protein